MSGVGAYEAVAIASPRPLVGVLHRISSTQEES
jgi:hypothetical protein